jgi:hypothetical protein
MPIPLAACVGFLTWNKKHFLTTVSVLTGVLFFVGLSSDIINHLEVKEHTLAWGIDNNEQPDKPLVIYDAAAGKYVYDPSAAPHDVEVSGKFGLDFAALQAAFLSLAFLWGMYELIAYTLYRREPPH